MREQIQRYRDDGDAQQADDNDVLRLPFIAHPSGERHEHHLEKTRDDESVEQQLDRNPRLVRGVGEKE